MTFWAYMVRCADDSYYTGHTDDLERRIGQHNLCEVAGYTQTRRPVELMWSQDFPSRQEALAAEFQVKDSRPTEDGAAIRRRRQCEGCAARFTTFERIQLRELFVLKSEGRREPFDREKLLRSLSIATRKRAIEPGRIDKLVSGIQRRLETLGENDVTSKRIGEMVMDGLKGLDSVAYIRFASVYRDFSEAKDFEAFAGSVEEVGRAE